MYDLARMMEPKYRCSSMVAAAGAVPSSNAGGQLSGTGGQVDMLSERAAPESQVSSGGRRKGWQLPDCVNHS